MKLNVQMWFIGSRIHRSHGAPPAAVAASVTALGEAAETSALIRRGLKELAQ